MELETVLKTILLDVPVIECFIQIIITGIALKITNERLDDEVISTVTLNCAFILCSNIRSRSICNIYNQVCSFIKVSIWKRRIKSELVVTVFI